MPDTQQQPLEVTPEDREEIDALGEAAKTAMDRRAFVRRAAIIAWTVPVIETFAFTAPANAQSGPAETTEMMMMMK